MRYWWVFGGTCAGKKTLIRELACNERMRQELGIEGSVAVAWFEDGPEPLTPLDQIKADNVLIRWQWDRTQTLTAMIPFSENRIIEVRTPIVVRVERALHREGWMRWGAKNFQEEDKGLAKILLSFQKLPRIVVDGSTWNVIK